MITIATDGSCIGNPGPGAYAIHAVHTTEGKTVSTFSRAIPHSHTTVGEMEVRGLLEALLFIQSQLDEYGGPILIQCDSQYVVKGYNEWMAGWKAKGWRKKGGLAHAELWQRIEAAKTAIISRVTVEWVRAHQNNGSLNDEVDALANNCARSQTSKNGPALQEGEIAKDEIPPSASSETKPKATPSQNDLFDLLAEAQKVMKSLRADETESGADILIKIDRALKAR